MSVEVLHGDARLAIELRPDASIDSVVTDPPYALVSITKRFGSATAAPARSEGATGVYRRAAAGFMGKQWDNGEVAFDPEFWAEVLRVLKPGGHVLAFGGTRTYHRLACAIEDAGFEIRDQIGWLYGTGFPKSHDVSKGLDAMAGAERVVVGSKLGLPGYSLKPNDTAAHGRKAFGKFTDAEAECAITAPATDLARQWQGWGTALKPAWEPIVLARKPLIGTVAENVAAHGTGAINVDGCRVPMPGEVNPSIARRLGAVNHLSDRPATETEAEGRMVSRQSPEAYRAERPGEALGRFPANVIHDGSDEVIAAFPDARGQIAAASSSSEKRKTQNVYGEMRRGNDNPAQPRDAGGSAARFFYSAKAGRADRAGSKHPTVKPVALMRYLCRLVTPPGGTVLDPFAGSGTTGQAAREEGFRAVLIEREAEYVADIRRRLGMALTAAEAVDDPEGLFA